MSSRSTGPASTFSSLPPPQAISTASSSSGRGVAARTFTASGVIERGGVICIDAPVVSAVAPEKPAAGSSVKAQSIHVAMSRVPVWSPADRRSLTRSSRIAAALA